MSHVEPSPPTQTVDDAVFTCTSHVKGRGAAWVTARGELDLAGVCELERVMRDALMQAVLVIIDLQQLTFIDSAGVHLLLEADASARELGRRVVVIHGSGSVGRLFALLDLAQRLKLVDLAPGDALSGGRPVADRGSTRGQPGGAEDATRATPSLVSNREESPSCGRATMRSGGHP